MKSREETWRGDAEVAAVRTGKDSKRTTARVAAQGWTGNGRALFGGSGLGEGSGVKSYQQGRGRNAKKAERKVGKGKGKETIPGSCKNPLSPRGRAREGLASFASGRPDGLPTARYARNSRYHEAGAAADEIIETCFGTDDDRNLWAYYCYHHDIETILEKARELKSRFRQGELKNPVTAFQRWLTRTYGCEGEGSR